MAAGLTLVRGQAVGQTLDSAAVATAAERVMSKTTAALGSAPAPGCAVGVGYAGRPVYEGAFGMADLEFDIPNTPGTIFESGSVAKQFTAASIVVLALEGKLRLDDPVRKYVPELPDYGAPLTLRHLLNHTSGIRDWGSVLALTGYGRGARLIGQDLALWVIEQQKAVDFTPGDEYSYSNSGYTLLSTIVERVSHQSLAEFTAEHFFKPLGMTHSSWRTDYTALVPGRAQAYGPAGKGQWRLSMPFMNVYGNGGLLTTVGDWLKWNAMLDSRRLGGEDVGAMVDSLERQGRLNDGREITYALGLEVTAYKGLREVAHGGATAGYRTFLTRLPGRKLSIAVMCNAPAPNANPTALAHRLVDAIAGPLPTASPPDTITVPADELRPWAGLWREEARHQPVRIVEKNGSLTIAGRLPLRPLRGGEFQEGNGATRWRFEPATAGAPARATRSIPNGEEHFVKDTAWVPTPAELQSFTGTWHSDEAAATFSLAVMDGNLVMEQRPDRKVTLRPASRDLFQMSISASGALVWFDRDAAGAVTTLHVGGPRMRDMRFARQGR